MKYWGGKTPPSWLREIAQDRARPLVGAAAPPRTPQRGDIVLKPLIDRATYKQLFRVETWNTHDLLDGPFEHIRDAMDCAFEFGATARLAVWLDYSDNPDSHELDVVPLYYGDHTASRSRSVA